MKQFNSFKDLESNLILISGSTPFVAQEATPAISHRDQKNLREAPGGYKGKPQRPKQPQRRENKKPVLFNWQKHNEIKAATSDFIAKGQFKDAVLKLNELVGMFLDYIKHLNLEGENKKKYGDLNGSLRIYEILNQFMHKCVPVFLQRALCQFRIRETDACLKDLEFVLKYKPNSITGNQLLAKIEAKRKHFDKALASMAIISRIQPKEIKWIYATAHYQLKSGDFDSAVKTYREALNIDPRNPNNLYYQGKTCFDKNDHQRAKEILEKSLKKMKFILEYFHGRKKDYQTWLAMGETSKKLSLCLEENLMLVGDIHKILFQMQEAVENYSELIAFRPLFMEGHLKRAEVWSELQNWEHAVQDLSFYLSKEPENIPVHIKRGKIRQILHLYRESIEDFDFVLHKEPFHVPVYYKRAESYLHLADYTRAEKDICKYLQFKPQDSAALYLKAKIEFLSGKRDLCHLTLKEAILADENNISHVLSEIRTLALNEEKQFEILQKTHAYFRERLEECFGKNGSEVEWLRQLGNINMMVFDFLLLKCRLGITLNILEILPDIELLNALFKEREEPVLLLSRWNFHKGYPEKAIKILERFVNESKSESATVYYQKALFLYRANDFNQASKDIKKAIRFDPHAWENYCLEGIIYEAMNAHESMTLSWEKSFSLFPDHQQFTYDAWLEEYKSKALQKY